MWIETEELEKWSIGMYRMSVDGTRLKIAADQNTVNPVLTAKDIAERKVLFVADPFIIPVNGNYYLFFEMLRNNKGCIGLAESQDGVKWEYKQVVLEEPFHLSYPHVLSWEGKYYMLPESRQDQSVRLYQAADFPAKWQLLKTLIQGKKFVDPTMIHFQGLFWLFTADATDNSLYLYYSTTLTGEWQNHPANPIIKNDKGAARPGGPVIVIGDKLVRVAQNDIKTYGQSLRAFEITRLDTQKYAEKELPESPLLQASGVGWNKDGMHHLSACQVGEKDWIAAVDGKVNYRRYKLCAFVPQFAVRLFQRIWRI